MHRRPSALCLLLVLALPAAPADSTVDLGGYEANECTYVYAPVAADAAVARREVPPAFAVLGAPLAAVLIVTTVTCDVAVNGGEARRTVFSDVGVVVEGPGGEPGIHLYLLWERTDGPALAALLRTAGIAHEVAPVAMEASAWGPFTTTDAQVDGTDGAYRLRSLTTGFHEALSGTVVWWHQGPQGTVRLDQTFVHDAAHGEAHGVAEVHAQGRLAALIGTHTLVEANLPLSNLTATVRLVGP